MEIRIGTSGYSYPGPPPKGWSGVFYPRSKGRRFDQLEYYSRFFDLVEINSTFYSSPAPAMADGWVRKTPAGFLFSVKLWQKFTHAGKINQPAAGKKEEWKPWTRPDVDLFRSGIDPLARSGKLGALLAQYPPGFHCTPENVEKLIETLKSFRDYPKVVELRHRSWSDRAEETQAMLGEHGAGLALIDEPKFDSSIRQQFEAAGDTLYFRAHGRNAEKWWKHRESWERYDYCYSWEEVREMAHQLRTATAARPGPKKALVLFNNHARSQAVANALMLSREMGLPLHAAPGEAFAKAFPQLAGILPAPPDPPLSLNS